MKSSVIKKIGEFKEQDVAILLGKAHLDTSLERDMIASLSVHESIVSPFMGATMMISDSKGLLNSFPVEGGENIEIKLKTEVNGLNTFQNKGQQ